MGGCGLNSYGLEQEQDGDCCEHGNEPLDTTKCGEFFWPVKDILTSEGLRSIRVGSLVKYEGWNFNSDNYLFTTDTK